MKTFWLFCKIDSYSRSNSKLFIFVHLVISLVTCFQIMKILPAKVGFIPMPPFIVKNVNPANVFDKISTIDENSNLFSNELFRLARLNVTLVEGEEMGHCSWINNQSHCTGIMSMMATGEVDFATFVDFPEYEDYENKELFPNLKLGPMINENEHVFMARGHVPETDLKVNPYNIFQQFPLLILTLNLVVLLLVILLVNFKLVSRDKRISFLDALVLHTLRWSRSFVKPRRRIIMYSMLLYCFFSHYYYSGSIRSDLIVTIPEKFLKTLEEVVASNRTPAMFLGDPLIEKFHFSSDPIKREIYSRAAERGTLYSVRKIVGLSEGIRHDNQVAFFHQQTAVRKIQVIECFKYFDTDMSAVEELPKLGISDVFSMAHAGIFYALSIDREVENRVNKVAYWYIESGITTNNKYPVIDPRFASSQSVIQCLDLMDRKKEPKEKNIQLTSQVIPIFMKGLASGFGLAVLSFLLELLSTFLDQIVDIQSHSNLILGKNAVDVMCSRTLENF